MVFEMHEGFEGLNSLWNTNNCIDSFNAHIISARLNEFSFSEKIKQRMRKQNEIIMKKNNY